MRPSGSKWYHADYRLKAIFRNKGVKALDLPCLVRNERMVYETFMGRIMLHDCYVKRRLERDHDIYQVWQQISTYVLFILGQLLFKEGFKSIVFKCFIFRGFPQKLSLIQCFDIFLISVQHIRVSQEILAVKSSIEKIGDEGIVGYYACPYTYLFLYGYITDVT